MAKTRTFSINSAAYSAITVQSQCKRVRVAEDGSSGVTTDLLIKIPDESADAIRITMGLEFLIEKSTGFFEATKVVGYVKTVSGTVTARQVEDYT